MILANLCKTNIFSVNSGVFDTRLKILTPAPLVVLVTNIRYGYKNYILCRLRLADGISVPHAGFQICVKVSQVVTSVAPTQKFLHQFVI